jgi:hypothetical protein
MTTKPVFVLPVGELESSPEVPEGLSRSFGTSLPSGCRYINLLGCCLGPTMFHAIVTCLLTWVELPGSYLSSSELKFPLCILVGTLQPHPTLHPFLFACKQMTKWNLIKGVSEMSS